MSLASRLAALGLTADYKPIRGAEAFRAGELDDAHLLAEHRAACERIKELEAERQDVIVCVNLYGDELLHAALDNIGFAPRREGMNYDGPDPSVECAWPPCRNRLRRVGGPSMSGADHPQWCSKAHRALSKEVDDV